MFKYLMIVAMACAMISPISASAAGGDEGITFVSNGGFEKSSTDKSNEADIDKAIAGVNAICAAFNAPDIVCGGIIIEVGNYLTYTMTNPKSKSNTPLVAMQSGVIMLCESQIKYDEDWNPKNGFGMVECGDLLMEVQAELKVLADTMERKNTY